MKLMIRFAANFILAVIALFAFTACRGIADNQNDYKEEYLTELPYLADSAKNYERIAPFFNGLARVTNGKKMGFINIKGELVIDTIFDMTSVVNFKNGYALLTKGGKKCLYDTTCKEIPLPPYYEIEDAKDFMLRGVDDEYNYFIYNIKEKRKIYLPGFTFVRDFGDGLAEATCNHKSGYINKQGKVAIPMKYRLTRTFNSGFARVSEDGMNFHYINQKGEPLHLLTKYDELGHFENGVAMFKLDDKVGIINTKGKLVVQPKYEESIQPYDYVDVTSRNGYLCLLKNDTKHYFNLKGDLIYKTPMNEELKVLGFGKYLYVMRDDMLEFMMTFEGKRMDFMNGCMYVRRIAENLFVGKKDGKYGIKNLKGEVVLPFEFDMITTIRSTPQVIKARKDDVRRFFLVEEREAE